MAVVCVPGIVTSTPGQLEGEGLREVRERPGDEDVVVDANVN